MTKGKRGAGGKPGLSGREIVLGISGGIAAYKAAEVASQLVQRGAGVTVVMTQEATHFVGPLTFQAISRRRVFVDLFDPEAIVDPVHVTLSDRADLVAVVPATANVLGKIAHGIGDDFLTSLMLAVETTVLLAPAMNDRMWRNAAVQGNLDLLRKRGFHVVGPEEGFLVERRVGIGRLADPAKIVAEIERLVSL